MLDAEINEELAKLSPQDQEEAMRLLEKFYRNLARCRRHEADILASIANGLNDPHGLGHNHVERIRDFVRDIIREETKKGDSTMTTITSGIVFANQPGWQPTMNDHLPLPNGLTVGRADDAALYKACEKLNVEGFDHHGGGPTFNEGKQ